MLLRSSTPEQQERYRVALRGALMAGHSVLASGGEAMDAVVAAVSFMEGSSRLYSLIAHLHSTLKLNIYQSSL